MYLWLIVIVLCWFKFQLDVSFKKKKSDILLIFKFNEKSIKGLKLKVS